MRALLVSLIAAALLPLAGCESVEVLIGMRTRLDKVPITEVTASLAAASALAPGKSADLIITAAASDGKSYVTSGAGKGKVLFDSFTFDSALLKVSNKGVVSLPADPQEPSRFRLIPRHSPICAICSSQM